MLHKERPYYKKPEELHSAFGRVTDPRMHEDEKPKTHFPWGTAILVVLFFAFLIWDALYGGFSSLLFPGACE